MKLDVVRATARLLALDGAVFERVFELREAGRDATLGDAEANELFAEYIAQVERVIESVDKLEASVRM